MHVFLYIQFTLTPERFNNKLNGCYTHANCVQYKVRLGTLEK